MKTVDVVQGSAAWHKWRREHIGASDVPAIMGTSDFMSATELWETKTGRRDPFKGNFATERGRNAEPKIRALYEELYRVRVTAPVVECAEWPVLSASLDGYSEELGIIAEFKYPGAAKHEMAKAGTVPPAYYDQVQAQLLVTRLDTCHYVSYNGSGIEVVVVRADVNRQKEIMDACRAFWACIEEDVPAKKWTAQAVGGDELRTLSERYLELLRITRNAEEEMKTVKRQIVDAVPDKKATFHGLSLVRSERAGAVDYGRIPELTGVDVELYRKPPTEVVTIKEAQ